MFDTPVGGAAILAVIFILIGIAFFVAWISDCITGAGRDPNEVAGAEATYNKYLDRFEKWINEGCELNTEPWNGPGGPEYCRYFRGRGRFSGYDLFQRPAYQEERYLALVKKRDEATT